MKKGGKQTALVYTRDKAITRTINVVYDFTHRGLQKLKIPAFNKNNWYFS